MLLGIREEPTTGLPSRMWNAERDADPVDRPACLVDDPARQISGPRPTGVSEDDADDELSVHRGWVPLGPAQPSVTEPPAPSGNSGTGSPIVAHLPSSSVKR